MPDIYDEMGALDEGMDDDDTGLEPDAADDIDGEFAMHAAEAGFDTPEKQRALKAAIERCYALKDEAAGEEEVAETNLDSEDPLEAFA